MIKAVIFDMDGVISHTQILHSSVESEVLKKHGINLSVEEIVTKYAGIPDRIMFQQISKRFKKQVNPNILIDEKWKIMYESKNKKIKPVEYVQDFILKLYNEKFTLAVASASPSHFIEFVLASLGIKNMFKAITSGDEVKRGKPNPDLFLLAAKKIEIKPSFCLVIEDSSNGVRAAKNAGMKCIGITTTHKKKELNEAHEIVDSFKEISIDKIKNL